MGYTPRYIPPNSLVEVTLRTFQGMHLLRPLEPLNHDIYAALARGVERYRVELNAFTFLSNHAHEIMFVRDAEQLENFLRYTNRLIGDAVRKHTPWRGPVFYGRPKCDVIVGDEKAIQRLAYVCSNGVKEGLVAHPTEWPGASSARALLAQREIVVAWSGRDDRRAARRDRQPTTSPAYQQTSRLRLAPLPCMAAMSKDQRRSLFGALFDGIARAAEILRAGRPPLGAAALRQARRLEPHPLEPSRSPVVHAATPEVRRQFMDERRSWLAAYRASSRRLAAGQLDVPFPPGALPPRRPFVPWCGAPAG